MGPGGDRHELAMRLGHRRRRRLEHRGWQHTLGEGQKSRSKFRLPAAVISPAQNKYSSGRFACDQFEPQP